MGIQGRDYMRDRPLFEGDGERPGFWDRRVGAVVALACAVVGALLTALGWWRTRPQRDGLSGPARTRSQEVLDAQAIGGLVLGAAAVVFGIVLFRRGHRGVGALAVLVGIATVALAALLELA